MARCEVCGNDYEASFEVVRHGETHTFDCFECAIHALAPACSHCGCRVIGHGTERGGRVFCCQHCARVGTDADAVAVEAEAEEGAAQPAGEEEERAAAEGEEEAGAEEEEVADLPEPSQERLDEIAQEARSVRQRAEEELTGPEQEEEEDEEDEDDEDEDEDDDEDEDEDD